MRHLRWSRAGRLLWASSWWLRTLPWKVETFVIWGRLWVFWVHFVYLWPRWTISTSIYSPWTLFCTPKWLGGFCPPSFWALGFIDSKLPVTFTRITKRRPTRPTKGLRLGWFSKSYPYPESYSRFGAISCLWYDCGRQMRSYQKTSFATTYLKSRSFRLFEALSSSFRFSQFSW